MERTLRRMVAEHDYLADEESVAAYAYDASGLYGKPLLVLKPRHDEQLRRILIHANQYRFSVVPRGAGTGIRGGTVLENSIVLDMRGYRKIENLDRQLNMVDVGAGVTITELNTALAPYGLRFPLVPENDQATIGGLAAQNHVTPESILYGDYHKLVTLVECFDGLGRHLTLKDDAVSTIIGWEGATGIMTKLRVKLSPARHKRTADIVETDDVKRALGIANNKRVTKGVTLLAYVNRHAAKLAGIGEKAALVIVYANDAGAYKDEARVDEVVRKVRELPLRAWRDGFTFTEEAMLAPESATEYAAWCEKNNAPWYCIPGMDIYTSFLSSENAAKASRAQIVAFGAVPVGIHGYGRAKKGYAPDGIKRRLVKLKEVRDYNLVLNPGVIA